MKTFELGIEERPIQWGTYGNSTVNSVLSGGTDSFYSENRINTRMLL